MNIEKINPNIKYVYHYTLKKNVERILNEKAIKSKDHYVFFTKSLNDSILAFDKESIYTISISHKGNYKFKEAKVL